MTVDFDTVFVDDVSKHYGRRRALAHVTLQAERGQVLGLFGPNGAGKSTLISVLSTSLRPSSGRVRYGTHTVDGTGDALRGSIGLLGHDLFVYADLTARENLRFFGTLYGLDRLDERVTEALALARLTDRADDRAGSFSRGLRQRLALERALLHQPGLVLLDEPFTGLDDASALVLIDRLRMLREAGRIVVMATHDFDTAETVVDRSVCVDRGRAWPVADGAGSLRARYRRTLLERA
ncbi:MAG: ABC transporter ATP-binding protein [Vicinamibacterales bacterium]